MTVWAAREREKPPAVTASPVWGLQQRRSIAVTGPLLGADDWRLRPYPGWGSGGLSSAFLLSELHEATILEPWTGIEYGRFARKILPAVPGRPRSRAVVLRR